MRNVRQGDDAVMKTVLGQPRAPIFDLNILPLLSLLIRNRTWIDHNGKELRRIGPQRLSEAERLLHAGWRFVQVANHEATMHHDARLLAAANELMRLFVVFGIAAVIIVLLHTN